MMPKLLELIIGKVRGKREKIVEQQVESERWGKEMVVLIWDEGSSVRQVVTLRRECNEDGGKGRE